eukprot:gene26753-35066_t
MALKRQLDHYIICEWGCGDCEEEKEQQEFDDLTSLKKDSESVAANRTVDGMTNQQYHEQEECHKRLVVCPLQCLEWVVFEDLGYHMDNLCTKRPAKPLECRRDGVGNSLEGQSSILFRLKMIDLNMKPRSVSFVLFAVIGNLKMESYAQLRFALQK